jgi:hypothetical protein
MADNQFQTYIKFDISDAESKIKKIESDILRWKDAMSKLDESNKVVINSFQRTIAGAESSIAKLRDGIENATIAQDKFINSSTGSYRALGSLDRVTREFASGSLTQGANGLSMFGNSLARIAAKGGGFGNALSQIGTSLTGPAGIIFGISALVGILEANKDKIADFFKSPLTAQDAYKNSLEGIGSEFENAAQKVTKVENAFSEYHKGIITGKEALRIYNEELGKNLGIKNNINDAEETFRNKTKDYIDASFQRALADAAGKKASEELLKQKLLERKSLSDYKGFVSGATLSGQVDVVNYKEINKKTAQGFKDVEINTQKEIVKLYQDIAKTAQEESDKLANRSGIDLDPLKTKKPKDVSVDKSNLEVLKATQTFYKDNIYEYKNYADLIVLEEERLAIKKAEKSKASAKEIANIHEVARIGLETNQKVLGENIAKILDKDVKEQQKIQKQNEKDLYDSQVYFANQRIKSIEAQSNVETKLFAGNYLKQKEAIKVAMAEIGAIMVATSNPKALMDLANAFDYLNNKLNAFGGVGKKITDMIDQMMISSFTSLGETIGNAITSGSFDFSAIGDIIANGLVQIGQALIAFATMEGLAITALKDPALWPVALAGGIAAVAAGTVLKNSLHPSTSAKKMAEGGIVSTPTFAMIGEGGQSEAVLPLNKLGNIVNNTFNAGMMNSGSNNNGNGQFILRGNDLVLALQRSNYSLNLRRGA